MDTRYRLKIVSSLYIYSSIKINYRKMQVLLDLTGFFVIIVLMFSSIEEVDYYA